MEQQQISLDTVLSFLVSTPLFEDLDQAELAEMVRIMHVVKLKEGETAFREGDTGDAWYVVYEGQAEVLKELAGGDSRQMAVLSPGALFGEIAILDGSARSATVRAAGPLTVFRFLRQEFDELLSEGSLAAYKIVWAMGRVLSQRYRGLTQQLSELLASPERTEEIDRAQLGELVARYKVSG